MTELRREVRNQIAEGAVFSAAPGGEELDWQLRGSCRDEDPDLFYPESPQMEAKSRRPIQICRTCQVLDDCRHWALDHREMFGVWGGMSEIEREGIFTGHRRHRRRSA